MPERSRAPSRPIARTHGVAVGRSRAHEWPMVELVSMRLENRRVRAILDRKFPERSLQRVLLVQPPDADASMFRFDVAKRRRIANYPPYGLLLLGRRLQQIDVQVRIENLHHLVLEQCHRSENDVGFDVDEIARDGLTEALDSFVPDLICITCMFTLTHTAFVDICRTAIASGTPVAVGGVHVTHSVERVLAELPGLNFIFLREGEVALERFVRCARGELSTQSLGQLIVVDGDETITMSADVRASEQEIDLLPAYDLFDVSKCAEVGGIGTFFGAFKAPGSRFSSVLSNRGCRAQCTFCSVRSFNGKGVRRRSVGSVLDELQYLEEHHGIDHITWLDDDLLKDHARAIELFDGIVQRGLSMTWDAMNGVIAASCTEEVCAAMAQSGCVGLNIGMESGNPEILRQVRKPGTVEVFLEAARQLRRQPTIHAAVYLMIGFPGETWRMILDTIDVAREMDLDWHRISTLQPLPQTPIYDSMVAAGLIADTESTDLRFMGGSFGRARGYDESGRVEDGGFEAALRRIPSDACPTATQLADIWFFMHYHLNFHRLFRERRPDKLRQLALMVRHLRDTVCPENGLALYFDGYLQHRTLGAISDEVIEDLEQTLAHSEYWRDRFAAFDLRVDDLRHGTFRNRPYPRWGDTATHCFTPVMERMNCPTLAHR